MSIGKQEFYEGAALHLIVRHSSLISISYEAPFFVVNQQAALYIKFSTRKRSPWGFGFTSDEYSELAERNLKTAVWIGLVCGSDGVAAISLEAYQQIAGSESKAAHIACYRRHREHYAISGPYGTLTRKVPPSVWKTLFGANSNA